MTRGVRVCEWLQPAHHLLPNGYLVTKKKRRRRGVGAFNE